MKKSGILGIHIGFWISYLLLQFILVAAATQGFTSGPNFGFIIKFGLLFVIFPSVSVFYISYFFLFPKYIQTRKIGLSLFYGILISVGVAFIASLLISLFFGTKMMFKGGYSSYITETLTICLIGFAAGIMSIIIKGFITWYDEIKLKEELNFKNHQIELALTKSQLDPHFLFNTINNIDVLILKSPELASEYLNKLSDILRFMLFETKTEKIALSQEIEYIEKYIALQKIRTSNERFVHFLVKGEKSNKTIPPMLFIPFIENAFKHVANKKQEDAINISLIIEDKSIYFECENKYSESNKSLSESNGLGNELIKKRIELIYPKKHTLVITNQNNSYMVNLTLSND
jgi:two-component system, LytTR family, sensor kinase